MSRPPVRRLVGATVLVVVFSLAIVAFATPGFAATNATDEPPLSTPVDSDTEVTQTAERETPSEQAPFGIRTVYNRSDLSEPTGGDGVTVAVLDTGVDTDHPDLRERVTLCRDYTGEEIRESCTDTNGHGTHVAGTVAGDGGPDGQGIYGVAPEAELFAFKTCTDDGRCPTDALADAIRGATDAGADVIVLSLGGRTEPRVEAGTRYATTRGVPVIAASGNAGPDIDSILYPAAHPNVIAVGAVGPRSGQQVETDNYRVPDFSSRGINSSEFGEAEGDLEVAAPGVRVTSPLPGGGYGDKSGTSMAAPHIAGLSAKLLGGPNPPETVDELRAELRERAPQFDVTEGQHTRPGYDPAAGLGIPTVEGPTAQVTVPPETPTDDEPFTLDAGASEPGDSAIAEYAWDTTGDGEFDRRGEAVEVTRRPGFTTTTLQVTDADGTTATASQEFLVNDRPRVSVTVPETVRADEPTTLSAAVENEHGETTVTWRLPDGTTTTGGEATHEFPAGESTVEVTVEDEFGAMTSEEVTVDAEPVGIFDQRLGALPAVVALLAALVVVSRRKR